MARKVREELEIILDSILNSQTFEERSDKKWVLATMSNVTMGLGKSEKSQRFEKRFLDFQGAGHLAQCEIDTFYAGKAAIQRFI